MFFRDVNECGKTMFKSKGMRNTNIFMLRYFMNIVLYLFYLNNENKAYFKILAMCWENIKKTHDQSASDFIAAFVLPLGRLHSD